MLADPVRRQVLEVLEQLETPERPSALARNLTVELDDHKVEDAEQLHVLLYHVHLPMLEDAGIMATDGGQKAVELTDEGRELMALLTE